MFVPLPAVVVLCVAGCSGGPSVAVPKPPPDQVKVCQALHKALPEKVEGQGRQDPEPDSDLTAGWGSGDAAVVLRCGVPRPAEMSDPQAASVGADGVDWLTQRPAAGWVFTTTFRTAYVEVSLGKKYQDGSLIADFAAAVKKADPCAVSSEDDPSCAP
jgi:hypothetical protein